jgi:hypothetical protein
MQGIQGCKLIRYLNTFESESVAGVVEPLPVATNVRSLASLGHLLLSVDIALEGHSSE